MSLYSWDRYSVPALSREENSVIYMGKIFIYLNYAECFTLKNRCLKFKTECLHDVCIRFTTSSKYIDMKSYVLTGKYTSMNLPTLMKKVAVFISFIVLFSCENKKAVKLRQIIDRQEKQSFSMLVGEKGLESKKLNYLIAHEYDSALTVVDQQEAEFNKIIKDLEKAKTEGISKGKELQQTSLNYYTAIKNLYIFSRQEIELEKLSRNGKGAEADSAQSRLLNLYREKKHLYEKVYQSENDFYKTLEIFQKENKLK